MSRSLWTPRKTLVMMLVAFAAAITVSTASAGGLFPSIDGGSSASKKVWVNTLTADGLRNTLIVNANVGDGADTPFYARLCRVSGDSTKYLVGAMAYSFDHTSKKWYAKYTVPNDNVMYLVHSRASTASTSSTGITGPTGATGATGSTAAPTSVSSGDSGATSAQLKSHTTNLQFVDSGKTLIRIGKLGRSECVAISGAVTVPDRQKVGAPNALFFRLVLGVTQINPDDMGTPEPTFGRMTASLYGSPLPQK